MGIKCNQWKSHSNIIDFNNNNTLQCRRLVSLTSWRRAAVVRGLAGFAVAELVDRDDPEAVGAVGVEAQLQVVEVPGHCLPLLPPPLLLLCVLLLPGLHDEL